MQRFTDNEQPNLSRNSTLRESSQHKWTHKKWWLFVALSISFVIFGQTSAVLLRRFYYAEGGSTMFLDTMVQTLGFPVVCVPLILIPPPPPPSSPEHVAKNYIVLIYISLGVLLAGNNLLSAVGLLYLSTSTFTLIHASQVAFGALLSSSVNSQKISPLILNSVVIITFTTAIVAVNEDSHPPGGVAKQTFAFGIICSIGAAALFPLLLSLTQLTFEIVLKAESFRAVLEMQIYTSLVASVVSIGGLFISGQWNDLAGEMNGFDTGPASYLMTLVWAAISYQVCAVGMVGLIFLVSSLFSNVVSTVALSSAPIASLIVFHDNMGGVKGLAMLLNFWGLATYLFQVFLDRSQTDLLAQVQSSRDIESITSRELASR